MTVEKRGYRVIKEAQRNPGDGLFWRICPRIIRGRLWFPYGMEGGSLITEKEAEDLATIKNLEFNQAADRRRRAIVIPPGFPDPWESF